jgi:hypothetical protein
MRYLRVQNQREEPVDYIEHHQIKFHPESNDGKKEETKKPKSAKIKVSDFFNSISD